MTQHKIEKQDRTGIRWKVRLLTLTLLCLLALTGCGDKVVLSLGLNRQEVFTVGDRVGHGYELRVYLANIRNEYVSAYGAPALAVSGAETQDNIRENALARLTKVKVLNNMAENRGISLNETETARALRMAKAYEESLTKEDQEYLKVTSAQLGDMYKEYYIAQKVYDSITQSGEAEISDDEARTVTVQGILIKTYSLDAAGNRVEFDESQRAQARARAEAILQEIRDGMANLTGVPFTTYISRYNEDSVSQYTIGRSNPDQAFVNAAFNAEIGKISDVVETADGYRIIKGITGYNEQEVVTNKEEIRKEREQEAFENAYDAFARDIDYRISEKDWKDITLPSDNSITTAAFFTTFDTVS